LFFDRAANLLQSSKAKIDRYKNVKFVAKICSAAKSKIAVLLAAYLLILVNV
jgi:hypothetical protein